MGIYLDPGNGNFSSDSRSEIYIDKTGMLSILNANIGGARRYFAVSRARRFGKSMAAGMLDAYYSLGCDSEELFSEFEIARDPDFKKYLNKFHVLYIDVSSLDFANSIQGTSNYYVFITRRPLYELPYSTQEIYGIRTTGRFHYPEQVYHTFYRLYPKGEGSRFGSIQKNS